MVKQSVFECAHTVPTHALIMATDNYTINNLKPILQALNPPFLLKSEQTKDTQWPAEDIVHQTLTLCTKRSRMASATAASLIISCCWFNPG